MTLIRPALPHRLSLSGDALVVVPPADEDAVAIGMLERLGVPSAFEARQVLLRGVPIALRAPTTAREWCKHLQTTGLGAFFIPAGVFLPVYDAIAFAFGSDGLQVTTAQGEVLVLSPDALSALVRAPRDKRGVGSQVRDGLCIYVASREPAWVVRLEAGVCDMAGLGPRRTGVARPDLLSLAAILEANAPAARKDARLLTLAGKLTQTAAKPVVASWRVSLQGSEGPLEEAALWLCAQDLGT